MSEIRMHLGLLSVTRNKVDVFFLSTRKKVDFTIG